MDPVPGASAALLRGHLREEVGLDQQKLLPQRESGGPAGRLREGTLVVIVASRCDARRYPRQCERKLTAA